MKKHSDKIKVGLLMIAIALAFVFLTGAMQDNVSSQIGRYRLSVVTRGSFNDLFVIDTATGIVKWVGKDQGKPFEEIKGD